MKLDMSVPVLCRGGIANLVTTMPGGRYLWDNGKGAWVTDDTGRVLGVDGQPVGKPVVWNGKEHPYKEGETVWTMIRFNKTTTKIRRGIVRTITQKTAWVEYKERNSSREDGLHVHSVGSLCKSIDEIEKRLWEELKIVESIKRNGA